MASDQIYNRQRRNTQRRLKGKKVKGKLIVKVGSPVDERLNCPAVAPVQFEDGTFGILSQNWRYLIQSDNAKANRAIKHSTKMPTVAPGIAGSVLWITAYPSKKNIAYAAIKIYYNDKAGRGDRYTEVSVKEATRMALEVKKARSTSVA